MSIRTHDMAVEAYNPSLMNCIVFGDFHMHIKLIMILKIIAKENSAEENFAHVLPAKQNFSKSFSTIFIHIMLHLTYLPKK